MDLLLAPLTLRVNTAPGSPSVWRVSPGVMVSEGGASLSKMVAVCCRTVPYSSVATR